MMHQFLRHPKTLSLCLCLLATSCVTHQVKMDQAQLRDLMMDYTEEQIVDNLIRTKNCRPIMHFDMAHIDALVRSTVSASMNGGHNTTTEKTSSSSLDTFTHTNTGTDYLGNHYSSTYVDATLKTFGSIVGTVTNPFGWGASTGRANTVDVQMVPVLGEDQIYTAYENFAKMNGGDTIRDSTHFTMPKPGPSNPDDPDGVHVGKKWKGVYYWVPNKYRHQFFKLCVDVALKRPHTAAHGSVTDALRDSNSEIRRLRMSE